LPHCDVFYTDNYTKEEIKLMNEPKKILGDDSLKITATAVIVGPSRESKKIPALIKYFGLTNKN
jgi:aspartate-semialdehyde dehydrogenase